MYVVIVGGGKVGSWLARMLGDEGHDVAVIEVRRDTCEKLANELQPASKRVRVVCGDGDEPSVLDEANIGRADAVVAATGHDEDNLVVCLLGKYEYQVPFAVARINNPKNEWLFTDEFGVNASVSNTSMIARILEQQVTEPH